MSRSPRGHRADQISIDDFNLGVERIHGAVPAGAAEAEAVRDEFYSTFVTEVEKLRPNVCLPVYGVHVYPIGRRKCVCKELTRSLDRVEAEFKELP